MILKTLLRKELKEVLVIMPRNIIYLYCAKRIEIKRPHRTPADEQKNIYAGVPKLYFLRKTRINLKIIFVLPNVNLEC